MICWDRTLCPKRIGWSLIVNSSRRLPNAVLPLRSPTPLPWSPTFPASGPPEAGAFVFPVAVVAAGSAGLNEFAVPLLTLITSPNSYLSPPPLGRMRPLRRPTLLLTSWLLPHAPCNVLSLHVSHLDLQVPLVGRSTSTRTILARAPDSTWLLPLGGASTLGQSQALTAITFKLSEPSPLGD